MILVDTSIWIEVFRRTRPLDLTAIVDFDDVVTCLPVIQEVLEGFRDERDFRIARDALFAMPVVESPLGSDVVLEAVGLYRTGRGRGLTIRSSVDCVIAACALRHDLEVLHRDRDFAAIARIGAPPPSRLIPRRAGPPPSRRGILRAMHPGLHAQTSPDKPALILPSHGLTVSYRELDERSNRGAQLFRALGLRPGDAIAILLENHPRFFEIVWGAQRSGLYYTPISTRLTAGRGRVHRRAIAARRCSSRRRRSRDVAEALRDRMPERDRAVSWSAARSRAYERGRTPSRAQPATPIADEIEGTDLLYSSGTTGRPKGVKLPLRGDPIGTPNALVGARRRASTACGADTVYLSPAPLYHAAPLRFNLAVQRLGGDVVVMEHFDAARVARADRAAPRHRTRSSCRRCSCAC